MSCDKRSSFGLCQLPATEAIVAREEGGRRQIHVCFWVNMWLQTVRHSMMFESDWFQITSITARICIFTPLHGRGRLHREHMLCLLTVVFKVSLCEFESVFFLASVASHGPVAIFQPFVSQVLAFIGDFVITPGGTSFRTNLSRICFAVSNHVQLCCLER